MGAVGGAATAAMIGTAIMPGIGTLGGLLLGTLGTVVGAELGKKAGDKFDFDVLDWLTGKNDKTPASETPVPKADWKTADGKMFSEHSASEQLKILRDKDELAKKHAAENDIKQQQFEVETARKQATGSQRHRQKDASQEEIDAQVTEITKEEKRKRTNWNQPFAGTDTKSPVVASMYNADDFAKNSYKNVSDSVGAKIKNEVDFVKSLFSSKDFSKEQSNLGVKSEKPENIQDANKLATDFWSSVGDFFKNVVEKSGTETNQPNHLDITQAESTGQRNHLGLEEFKMPEISISDMLPDFSLSEWLAEKTADIDLTSMLPDFSTVGDTIGEQLNVIPEKISEVGTSISEGFSQIPTAASEAFNTISTYANEGLTTIQTEWNGLPSFFGGLFAGLGGVATSTGSAIASGINSAIGTI